MIGGKNSEIEIEGGSMFSEIMRKAQNAYYSVSDTDWEAFRKMFEQDKKELLKDFNLFEDTALSVAIRSADPKLLRALLEMLSEQDRWLALTKPNCRGNTILHNIAMRTRLSVQMADVLLEFENKAVATLPEDEKQKRGPTLIERKNKSGETPLFRAAAYGNLKMLKHVFGKHVAKAAQPLQDDIFKIHCYSNTETILHACINARCFDVALWIINRMNGTRLAQERNERNLTCLQLLASMPEVFQSHNPMGALKNFIYYILPDERYQIIEGCDSSESCGQPSDIETGPHESAKPPTSARYLSRINYAVWKRLAEAFMGIKSLWELKRKHQLAKRLAEFLVKHDFSWQVSYSSHISDSQVQLPPVLYNVEKRKQQLERKEEREDLQGKDEQSIHQHYKTPLFIAASTGIEEIVDLFLKEHPISLNYMGVDGCNILHIAVRHRQLKIFKMLKKHPIFTSLIYRISTTNRTALHEVADIDYYRGSSQPGAAFKLQDELKWYKRVEKIIPIELHLHCDNQALTAKDVLDMEHHDMLEQARSWIQQTAQSCSTVAVLVATVVFAAAYTIPGGSEGGSPVFLSSPVFIFFTVMDIVALAFSLASVVMFLSILTSPFELWDFHKSLPQKLNVGFAFLFLALTTTMLAFCATILLTIRLQWKQWTSTLVYSAAFFPVTIFGLIEFPLYKKLPNFLHMMCKKAMKAINPIARLLRIKKAKNQ